MPKFNPPQINFFKPLAYYLDYYNMDNKFLGSLILKEPVSNKMGFHSKTFTTPIVNIKLDNKKIIKAGTDVYYKQLQLCGKYIGTQEEKINAMQQSQAWKLRSKSTS